MTNQSQNKRDSFIFYRSFYDASKCLKSEKPRIFPRFNADRVTPNPLSMILANLSMKMQEPHANRV